MQHKSQLPYAIDRAEGKDEQQSLVFHGERPFIQAAELNELQTIARGRHDRLGKLVAKEGDRIERADAFVDIEQKTVTLTEGKIYVAGDVLPVQEDILQDVSMEGRVEIGVRLQTTYITHEDDPELLGQVPGSLAEGEPGAAREIAKLVWALSTDTQEGSFYPVYVLQDGTIVDQKSPSLLEPAMQAIATYDKAHGHYIVEGCRVTALGQNAGNQVFSIEEGEANISGFKRTRKAALRHQEPELWEERAVPGETHTFPLSGTSYTFSTNQSPIGVINNILLTKEITINVTRGATFAGQDGLSKTSVTSIISVTQGTTTFKEGVDFIKTGDTIDWAPSNNQPKVGSTYSVKFRYRESITATKVTAKEITVTDGAAGGDIIISYTYKLPRIDRIGLNTEGMPVYIKGIASDQPFPPMVPNDILSLATITNNWLDKPSVVNDGVRSVPYAEQWRYYNRIVDHDRLIQLERMKSDIDAKDPIAKKGMFVDPFTDDSYRDEGEEQTAACFNGMLQLAIEPTFHNLNLNAPVMLDWQEETIITQDLITGCEKINPYANFQPLPGSMSINPAADFWSVNKTELISGPTLMISMGQQINGGPLIQAQSAEAIVDQRQEQAEFLRQIPVTYEIKGFGAGEIVDTLTFDGLNIKPENLVADKNGEVKGTFIIPDNIPAGTKTVEAIGRAKTRAAALFTGQGTISTDIIQRTTAIFIWQQSSDPQAQLFMPLEPRQIVGVDFNICKIGDTSKHILAEIVSTDNGYPTTDAKAQAVYSMINAKKGWASARFTLPPVIQNDTLSAFVIKTDDNEHSISLAKLGAFDTDKQQFVTSHPYTTGPRFSSVNAATWTAHQDEALTFRIVAAYYPETQKVVDLGTADLKDCSDLQIKAAVELPSANCSVVFEIERTNGTIYSLLPNQLFSLPEYITETVKIRAVLKGTNKLSPVLYAPVLLISGKIATSGTYITRAFNIGENVRISSYLKAFLPGGATLNMHYSLDGGAWKELPLSTIEELTYNFWTERKFEATNLTARTARLKITMAGGPAARVIAGDFGTGIF